jgi:hypothetical protein
MIGKMRRDYCTQNHGAVAKFREKCSTCFPSEAIHLPTSIETGDSVGNETPDTDSTRLEPESSDLAATVPDEDFNPIQLPTFPRAPAQIMVTSADFIYIHNLGMDLWIHRAFFTVRFGDTEPGDKSKSYVVDLLRILQSAQTTDFIIRRLDKDYLSIQLVDPSQEQKERRSTCVVHDAVCIRQPKLYLHISSSKGNIQFGNLKFPADLTVQTETNQPHGIPQDIDSTKPFPLVRSPFMSVDVRSDGHQIYIEWELV